MTAPRATIVVSIIGALSVTAYAVWGAAQIIFLTPLAAVPGRSVGEIRAEMDAVGESPVDISPVLFLVFGIVLAVGVAVLVIRTRGRADLAALVFLALLVLGGPAFFMASFGPGMSLSDTFMISGGVTLPGVAPLYAVSALAALGCVVLGTIVIGRARLEPAAV